MSTAAGWGGRVHLVGIGGAGMSGIARILLAQGVPVSGSDAKDSRRLSALRALGARIALDESRLLALAPGVDLELVRRHLAAIPAICAGHADAGPIGALPPRARFHWLTARRSSIIQTSPVHTGRCGDPEATLDRLLAKLVR